MPRSCCTGLEVIANQLGKKLDEDNPSLHAQLPDGSRLAAWIPPIVRPSPALAIRKFTSRRFTIDDLIARGTLTRALADFLGEQIACGKTLLISGGTGTGKTTLLRILADFIPDHERIVVIEDTPELHIRKPNIVAAGVADGYVQDSGPIRDSSERRSPVPSRPDHSGRSARS